MNNEMSIDDELDEVLEAANSRDYRAALEHLNIIKRVMQEHPDSQEKFDRTERSLLEKVASGINVNLLIASETMEGGVDEEDQMYKGFKTSLVYLRELESRLDGEFGLNLCPQDMKDHFFGEISNTRKEVHKKAVSQLEGIVEDAVILASNGFFEVKYTEMGNRGKPDKEVAKLPVKEFAKRAGSALEMLALAELYFCNNNEREIDMDMKQWVKHGAGRIYLNASTNAVKCAEEHAESGKIIEAVQGLIYALEVVNRALREADQGIKIRESTIEKIILQSVKRHVESGRIIETMPILTDALMRIESVLRETDERIIERKADERIIERIIPGAYRKIYEGLMSEKESDEQYRDSNKLRVIRYQASGYLEVIKIQFFGGEPSYKFAQDLYKVADKIVKEANRRLGIKTEEKPSAEEPPEPPQEAFGRHKPTVIGVGRHKPTVIGRPPGEAPRRKK